MCGVALDDILSRKIGYITRSAQRHVYLPGSGGRSTTAGNWQASITARIVGAEIGFVNNGGLRTDVLLGDGADRRDVTHSDLYTMFPFDNKIYCYRLTWADLLKALEYALTEKGGTLLSQISGADIYYTDRTVNAIVTSDGLSVYANGQWREGWRDKTFLVGLAEFIATTDRVSDDGVSNPFVAWNQTGRLIEHTRIDKEGAVQVLSAEAAENDGRLRIDTAAHFIDSAYPGSVTDKLDPPVSASELVDAMRPTVRTDLVYTGREQALVAAPVELAPEGYSLRYSIDGGKTWTEAVPCGVEAGSYTVFARFVSEIYSDLALEPLEVTIRRESSGADGTSRPGGTAAAAASVGAKPAEALPFADVSPGDGFYDGVRYVYENGVMNGVDGDRFDPDGPATRATAVTMLWRLEGQPQGAAGPFTDVPAGTWYTQAVNWAAEAGLVNGVSETAFEPDAPVTREQLEAILYRCAQARGRGFQGAWSFPLDFRDAAEVSGYADEAMHWVTAEGIFTGMEDGTLAPRANVSRAQIAVVFIRFCG